MDTEFLVEWCQSNTFATLANILSRTPSIQSLRILVADNNGPRSAWRKFGSSPALGVAFSAAFADACSSIESFTLSMLTTIELDGFESLSSLLRITPNLTSLSARMSGGFSQASNVELAEAVKFVPGLKTLEYTPESLRMYSAPASREETNYPVHGDVDLEMIPLEINESSVEFVKSIAQTLPQLETLDLTSRSFGTEVSFCSAATPIRSEDLNEALVALPNIKNLSLPSSLITEEDIQVLRTALPTSSSEKSADIAVRHTAIVNTEAAERLAVEQAGQVATKLQTMTFVRHAFSEDVSEYAVGYRVQVYAPRTVGQWSKPGKVEVVEVQIAEAHVGNNSVQAVVAREQRRSLSKAMKAFARDHRVATVALVSGCAYACTQLI